MKDIKKAIKHFKCVRDAAVAVLDSGFGKSQMKVIFYTKIENYMLRLP